MMRLIRALLGALGGVGVLISNCDPGAGAVGVRAAQAAEASGQRSERGAVTERAAKEPTPNASDCLTFQNDVQEKSIVVHAKNVCERKLSCSLTFVVRCEDNAGKPTSSTRGSARFTLAEQGSSNVEMSAEQCKQGWNIDDVSWACH